jgi:hypothetical protein
MIWANSVLPAYMIGPRETTPENVAARRNGVQVDTTLKSLQRLNQSISCTR